MKQQILESTTLSYRHQPTPSTDSYTAYYHACLLHILTSILLVLLAQIIF